MLITSNSHWQDFLRHKRLFLDSSVLISWAADSSLDVMFDSLQKEYSFITCTASLLEIGFGPPGRASKRELERAKLIYDLGHDARVDAFELHRLAVANQNTPRMCVYNPTHLEWYATRYFLIKLIGTRGDVKRARELATDALIYFCSWNARAAIVTENVKDFAHINAMNKRLNPAARNGLPIFTVSDLGASLVRDVCFPENLPEKFRPQ